MQYLNTAYSNVLTKRVDVEFINEIPQPLDHILDLLHAFALGQHSHTANRTPGQHLRDIFRSMYCTCKTHSLDTEAHSAGLPFAEVQETPVGLDKRGAGAIVLSAADFTGVLRF